MDRGGLADRPVKLAEAASLSDDPWYGQRLDALAHDLAAQTREILGIFRQAEQARSFSLLDHAAALVGWTRRNRSRAGDWRSAIAISAEIPAAPSAP
jgi:hypothetical protein